MGREIHFQSTERSNATLYAVLDFQGKRWNGTSFVTPTAGNWATYAIAMSEDTGTGHFVANVPAGITVSGRLDVTVFVRNGATPLPTDVEDARDMIVWNGHAETGYDQRYDIAALSQGYLATATSTTVTFTVDAGPLQDVGQKAHLFIVSGLGAGQTARITAYNTSTRVATLDGPWIITPDATSYVAVYWATEWRATLAPDGLDAIATAAPAGASATFPQMLVRLYRRFFAKATQTATQLKTYGDDGTTILTTQSLSDDGTTLTQSAAT